MCQVKFCTEFRQFGKKVDLVSIEDNTFDNDT